MTQSQENSKDLLELVKAGSAKYFDKQMDILKQFSAIDCPTNCIEGNDRIVAIIKDILSELDVTIEEIVAENVGTHILARIKPENPDGKIIISAHTDTFPGFEVGDVEKHPYRIEGDWAYGIGICDCKAGILSSIYAVKMIQDANLLPNKEIVMIYSCDEEVGSQTSKPIFEKEAVGADMAFVFEPTRDDNGIITQRKGIAIGKIKITGKACHSAIAYKDGRSAAKELAHQTVRLFDYTDFTNITYDVSMMYSNKGMSDLATARLAASLKSEDGIKMFHQHMDDITNGKPFVDGCTCSVDIEVMHPMMERNEKNLALLAKVQAVGKLIGQPYPEQLSEGSGDACLIHACGVPTIDGLGPYMKDIHTFNERLYIPSLSERTEMFALLLATL